MDLRLEDLDDLVRVREVQQELLEPLRDGLREQRVLLPEGLSARFRTISGHFYAIFEPFSVLLPRFEAFLGRNGCLGALPELEDLCQGVRLAVLNRFGELLCT